MRYEMKLYLEAQKHYVDAKYLDPENPLHHVYLAQVYIRINRMEEAKTLILNALTLDSNYHEAYATMSDLFLKKNDLPRALQQIDKAMKFIELDDRGLVVEYVVKRARILRRMNEPDAAMQAFDNDLHDHERYGPKVAVEIAKKVPSLATLLV